MKWLKHKGQLINLSHMTAIQVKDKEVEFRGERHESVEFNSEEAAEAYFEHIAGILEVKE